MVLFIGLPIISTGVQSFYAQHDQVVKEVKKCDPFGCTVSIVVDNEETTKIREAKPLGKFNGFGTYIDRNHLAIEEIKEFWNEAETFDEFVDQQRVRFPMYTLVMLLVTVKTPSLRPLNLAREVQIEIFVNDAIGARKEGQDVFNKVSFVICQPLPIVHVGA